LAVLVKASKFRCPPPLGAIVRLTVISYMYSDAWMTDPPIIDPADGREVHLDDSHLRPIRDPGDDAADESHAWLPPVPTATKEFV
jgi:hypothetical protein